MNMNIWPVGNLLIEVPGDSQDAAGIYDEVIVRDCYRLRSILTPPAVVLDLGAFYGAFSVFAAAMWPDARIVAVEGNPHRVDQLQANVARNGLSSRVAVCPTAVVGTARASGPPEHLAEIAAWMRDKTTTDVLALIERFGVPDLLKIDIEGWELGVLERLHQAGLLARIPVITGEWHFREAHEWIMEYVPRTHELTIEHNVPGWTWEHFFAVRRAA